MTEPSQRTMLQLRDPGAAPAVTVGTWDGAWGEGPVVVLAHGAGSSLRHATHVSICGAVAAAGPTVVSFNFSYAEAQRRSPDRMPRLLSCFRDVLALVGERFPHRPVVTGGRSMGGRAASLLEAEQPMVAGLALLNYPLVGVSKSAATPRTDHWLDLAVPVLFVHGTRDRLLPLDLFAHSLPLLSNAAVTVHEIEGADHGFAVPRSTGRTPADVHREVAETVAEWVRVCE